MNAEKELQMYYRIILTTLIVYVVVSISSKTDYIVMDKDALVAIWADIFVPILCAIGAVLLFLFRHKSLRAVLIITTFILCVSSFGYSYLYLVEYAEITGRSVINFIEGALELFIGVFLFINLIVFTMRVSNNTMLMFFSTLALMTMQIVDILTSIRMEVLPRYVLIYYVLPSAPIIILTIVLMVMMRSKTIKSETMLYNIKMSFDDIKDSSVPIGVTIPRSTVKKLCDMDAGGTWCESYEFIMSSAQSNRYKTRMFRKDGRTYVTISSLNDSSFVDGYRFILRGVHTDTGDAETCDTVRIYGEDGFFVQLSVRDAYDFKPKKVPIGKRIKFWRTTVQTDRNNDIGSN